MTTLIAKRLELRLAATVGVSLLAFSMVIGFLTYNHAYRYQLQLAESLQQRLVATVQAQAEVAAFAANTTIAQGVIAGLLANPIIEAARIETFDGFKFELGSRKSVSFSTGKNYPLFSPVDHIEPIGSLVIIQNEAQVDKEAVRVAVLQTALMLAQVLLAAILLIVVLRIMIIHPITRMAYAMAGIKPGSSNRLGIDEKHTDDEIGLLAKSANALLDAAETAIEEVRAQRNELEGLATHDHLTGLPTKRLADDRLQIACNSARRTNSKVALLFVDLDGFKAVNDDHGHEIGDEVLKEVAKRLRESIRAEDTAARIGGDEFLVIVGNLPDADTAALVAENIGNELSHPISIADHTFSLGASIGIAIFPDHTHDIKTMRRIADVAMYSVKKSGKGHYAFAAPVLVK